jgi:hypothetical protein
MSVVPFERFLDVSPSMVVLYGVYLIVEPIKLDLLFQSRLTSLPDMALMKEDWITIQTGGDIVKAPGAEEDIWIIITKYRVHLLESDLFFTLEVNSEIVYHYPVGKDVCSRRGRADLPEECVGVDEDKQGWRGDPSARFFC